MKTYPQETPNENPPQNPQFWNRKKPESWPTFKKQDDADVANVALEKRLKSLDPISKNELFTEAQMEDFHRRVMNAVTMTEMKPAAKVSARSAYRRIPPWQRQSLRMVRSLPFVSMLGILLFNLPHSVKAQFQKISSAVSYNQKH